MDRFRESPESYWHALWRPAATLRIAASIACAQSIVLGDEITGLDYDYAQLALVAIAQAAGYGAPVSYREFQNEEVVQVTKPALLTWPGE